jgi:peptide chain release factor 3
VSCSDRKKFEEFRRRNEANLALDNEGRLSFLATSEWSVNYTMEEYPEISFHKTREYN